MVHKRLKRLMFLMLLLLGVGQTAQATKVYADLSKATAEGGAATWENNTFTWTAAWDARVAIRDLPSDFSEYTNLVLEVASSTAAFRIDFESVSGNVSNLPNTMFGDAITEKTTLTIPINELGLTEEQLTSMVCIRVNTNSGSGSVTLNSVYLEKPFELTFNNAGQAYIYPSDMEVTGMSFNPQTGELTKTETGNGRITINFGDMDFSNVTNIKLNRDAESEGYKLLLSSANLQRTDGENVHTTGAFYNFVQSYGSINYTEEYQARSEHIQSLYIDAAYDSIGTMKITSICITKDVISANAGGETDLHSIPYVSWNSETNEWVDTNPDWNVGVSTDGTVYGSFNSTPDRYADLSAYDELRIYQTSGQPLRYFFRTSDETTGSGSTESATLSEAGNYYTLNLNSIKEKYGKVELIGIKTASNGSPAFVEKIVAVKPNPQEDYVFAGMGDFSSETEAALANPNATVIDATGLTNTEPITLESANPNCLFIANEGILANESNVLIADENGGYTCENLVLDVTKPFRMPGTITATTASAKKSVSEAGYATMVLPFEVSVPKGVTAYKLTSVEGEKVMGEALANIPAGQPVLLKANAADYTFTATGATLKTDQQPDGEGLLTGVYADDYAPAGSYVLQNNAEGVAFYNVENDNAQRVVQYTAYLTLPETAQQANRLIFALGENDVTGIKGVETAAESTATVVEIYDLSGRQVSAPVKGINLMKMSDGSVKKVIVK